MSISAKSHPHVHALQILCLAALLLAQGWVLTPVAHAATPMYVRPGGDDTNCNGTANVDYPTACRIVRRKRFRQGSRR